MNRPNTQPPYLVITWTEAGEERCEWSPQDEVVKARANVLRDAGVRVTGWRTGT